MSELRLELLSEAATEALGRAIASVLSDGDVVALHGELGAGKTRLVRGLALGLGADPDEVSSPTFVLMHEYEPDTPDGLVLIHIDAYRLSGPQELSTLGWTGDGQELRRGAVVAIEWASRIATALPPDHLAITLSHQQGDSAGAREAMLPDPEDDPRAHAIREAFLAYGDAL